MWAFLTVMAVVVGLVCGLLYSFVAVLLTGPLLALVGFEAAVSRGYGFGISVLIAIGTVALSQTAFLAGTRLRYERRLKRQKTVCPAQGEQTPREHIGG